MLHINKHGTEMHIEAIIQSHSNDIINNVDVSMIHSHCAYRKSSSCTAEIAQLGERQTEDLKVPGSIPGLGNFINVITYDILYTICTWHIYC